MSEAVPDPQENESEEIIKTLFEESMEELFEVHGLAIQSEEEIERRNDAEMLSIVGASSEQLKISIFLQSARAVVTNTYPQSLGEPTPDAIRDWAGELSNQLMGRLKNKLVTYECRVVMGIPTVIVANGIEEFLPRAASTRSFSFTTNHGDIEVTLSLVVKPSLVLEKTAAADDPFGGDEEGELVFF